MREGRVSRIPLVVCGLFTLLVLPLHAQQDPAPSAATQIEYDGAAQAPTDAAATAAPQSPDPGAGRAGYATGPVPIEGPDGVPSEIETDDIDVGAIWKPKWFDGAFDPWWALKKKWNKSVGLRINFSYQTLRQSVDHSPGEDTGAAYRAQVQGMWTLAGRHGKNPGSWSFRYEYRNTLDSNIPPSDLAGQAGIYGQTATGFNDFGSSLSEFSWRQTLFSGKVKAAGGKISATSWYNGFILSTPMKGFQNVALQSSNTKPSPGRGIGAGVAVQPSDAFAIVAGIHDANAKTADDNPFDTLELGEFYESAEFRWFPNGFSQSQVDQVRLQIWHQDERVEAGVPAGQGVTALGSFMINDKWLPFAFCGLSDGKASLMEADFSTGLAVAFNTVHRASRDVLAIGYNWARPSSSALDDQYTWELFYRFQLVKNIAFTASTQLILDPALNPDEDSVWLGGLKARFTF